MENRFSSDHFQRQSMLENLRVPTISEAKLTAGLQLSIILFEECHPDLQEDFGLKPHLRGPQGELWTSPSDILIGKVALKPPMTQKHMQALTHQGIIELGSEMELKFFNEMSEEKERALKAQENFLRRLFELQQKEMVEEVKRDEAWKYEEELCKVKTYYESKIITLLSDCGSQVERLLEEMQIEFDSLNVLWEERMMVEINETVERITEEFLEKMGQQEKILVNTFSKKIRDLKINHRCTLDFEQAKCEEALLQLRHKFHCENVTNLMYLLCKERRRCKSQKSKIVEKYETVIRDQKKKLREKSKVIRNLTRIKNKKTRQVNVREKCLVEILRQFQKFIYFALKATPTQGEFLLNVNKLLEMEVKNYCIEKKPPQVVEATVATSSVKSVDYQTQIEEFLKRTREAEDEEEWGLADALPAFYFNDRVYVREEFRDLIAAGVAVDKYSTLWNPEVEELLQIFKNSICKRSATPLAGVKSHQSSVHFSNQDGSGSVTSQQRLQKTASQLSPSGTPPIESVSDDEKEIRRLSLGDPPLPEKKPKKTKRNSLKSQDDFEIRPIPQRKQSRLSFTRDSIILHLSAMERKSLQNLAAKVAEESSRKESSMEDASPKGSCVKVKLDSCDRGRTTRVEETCSERGKPTRLEETSFDKVKVIKTVSSDETDTTNISPVVSSKVVKGSYELMEEKHTSKLLLATDSLEIIKSSIGLTSGTDKDKEKVIGEEEEPRKKSQLSFNPKVIVEGSDFHSGHKGKPAKQSKKKPAKPRAKIAGARNMKSHDSGAEQFAEARINSLVNLMRTDSSIIRLFTQCQ